MEGIARLTLGPPGGPITTTAIFHPGATPYEHPYHPGAYASPSFTRYADELYAAGGGFPPDSFYTLAYPLEIDPRLPYYSPSDHPYSTEPAAAYHSPSAYLSQAMQTSQLKHTPTLSSETPYEYSPLSVGQYQGEQPRQELLSPSSLRERTDQTDVSDGTDQRVEDSGEVPVDEAKRETAEVRQTGYLKKETPKKADKHRALGPTAAQRELDARVAEDIEAARRKAAARRGATEKGQTALRKPFGTAKADAATTDTAIRPRRHFPPTRHYTVTGRVRPGAAGPFQRRTGEMVEQQEEVKRKRRRRKMLDEFQSRMYYHYELPTICKLMYCKVPELMLPPCLSTTPVYE